MIAELGQFRVQRLDPVGPLGNVAVSRDGRPVIRLEKVAERCAVGDVCDFDPGYEVAATVETSLRTLIELWRGDVSWSRATLSGDVTIEGGADARRAVPGWIGQSRGAAVARPA